jgi:hypothetical protein
VLLQITGAIQEVNNMIKDCHASEARNERKDEADQHQA